MKFEVGRKIYIRKYKNYIKVKQLVEEFETMKRISHMSGLKVMKRNSVSQIGSMARG